MKNIGPSPHAVRRNTGIELRAHLERGVQPLPGLVCRTAGAQLASVSENEGMSGFSFCRVCQLWKMLVEHSAPWRHVPDILQSMYGFYLGKRSKVSALNRRGSSDTEPALGSLERGGGISDG